jgi:ATP-dependent Clp protease adaptor protein ClpS
MPFVADPTRNAPRAAGSAPLAGARSVEYPAAHVGRCSAMADEDTKKHVQPAGDLAVATQPRVEQARRFMVVFYNDDYTTKWFVIDVLKLFFHMSEANATALMLLVHETGRGVAGVYTRDVAETKVAQVHAHAKEWGMPLRLDVEPEDG